ncbi:MAG TPA: hypothetical protein VMF30_14135 [Pirellulales bacterium]|nr:hypothetical protein [Pirellulales bacterium]
MHTVELLEEAIELAERSGFHVRAEWLAGRGTGWCVLKGQNCLFLDLSETPREQLDRVTQCLREQPQVLAASMSPTLRRALDVPQNVRKAA